MSGSSTATVTSEAKTPQYRLSDDLAKLCLPSEYKDATRTLAWVNSICLLFLVIGFIGIKQPIIVSRPLSEIVEPVMEGVGEFAGKMFGPPVHAYVIVPVPPLTELEKLTLLPAYTAPEVFVAVTLIRAGSMIE